MTLKPLMPRRFTPDPVQFQHCFLLLAQDLLTLVQHPWIFRRAVRRAWPAISYSRLSIARRI